MPRKPPSYKDGVGFWRGDRWMYAGWMPCVSSLRTACSIRALARRRNSGLVMNRPSLSANMTRSLFGRNKHTLNFRRRRQVAVFGLSCL